MTPKEIGRKAMRIFKHLIPTNWAIRNQEDQEDYGIDCEVELTTDSDQATGFIFKAQVKGTEAPDIIDNGNMISFSDITVAKVGYYLKKIEIPVIFVVVDVSKEIPYWVIFQGNSQIIKAYENRSRAKSKAKDRTMSIHLPICNTIPVTVASLLEAVADCKDHLLVQGIRGVDSGRLSKAAQNSGEFDALIKTTGAHHDYFRLDKIEQLLRSGKRQEALKRSMDYLISPSESIELRFAGGHNVMRISQTIGAIENHPNKVEEMLKTRFDVCSQLLKIVRQPDISKYWRTIACFWARTARLRMLVEKDFGLFMSNAVQTKTGDNFTRMITHAAQVQAAMEVMREFHKTQMALMRLAEHCLYLLPEAWSQMAMDSIPFIYRLRQDHLEEAVQGITKWFDSLGELAIKVAVESKHWPAVALCATPMIFIGDMEDKELWDERVSRVRQHIDKIEDVVLRQESLKEMEHNAELPSRSMAELEANPDPSIEEEIAMCRGMAASYGIDPDNPKDDLDRVVMIGLLDLNPERILRHCQHLFFSLGFWGIPGQMLGLPTAGEKFLHCTKHHHTFSALSLDDLYMAMSHECCHECHDCTPHLKEWKWNKVWQQEQNEKWKKYAELKRF